MKEIWCEQSNVDPHILFKHWAFYFKNTQYLSKMDKEVHVSYAKNRSCCYALSHSLCEQFAVNDVNDDTCLL